MSPRPSEATASTSGHDAFRQLHDVIRDGAGPGEPHLADIPVPQHVLQGTLKREQTEWLTYHEGVERDAHDQWLALGELQHLIELVGDDLGKVVMREHAVADHGRVV